MFMFKGGLVRRSDLCHTKPFSQLYMNAKNGDLESHIPFGGILKVKTKFEVSL